MTSKLPSLAIATGTLALCMAACSSLTPADKQAIAKVATATAVAAATNAVTQYDNTGHVDAKKVTVVAADAAINALPSPTP